MKPDPIVAEVRGVRKKISRENGGSLAAYAKKLKALEKQHADRLVTPEMLKRLKRKPAKVSSK